MGAMRTLTSMAGVETTEIAGRAVPLHYGDSAAEYLAGRSSVVVVARSHEGRVHALGRDRLDLLHRMSTNDLTRMAAGEARPTVLTTAHARTIDLIWVLDQGETAQYPSGITLCLTGPGNAELIRRWLSGYIFFRDQVKLDDASSAVGQLGIYGPRAAEVAGTLSAGAETLARNHFVERDGLIVLRARPLGGDGFTFIAPTERTESVWAQAVAAGAAPAGEAAFQMLRLAEGQPYAGRELTNAYIPLEANLWEAVSSAKGCYLGQEIIARMESRGKLARRLVGLKLDAPVAESDEVRAGEGVVGSVTSAGVLPDLGSVALAFVRIAHAEPGTRVTVGAAGGTVVNLPFAT
jgi:aminomethyltransferase